MASLPAPILEALQFEASNRANGSVLEDAFYDVPKDAANATPGTSLKVEDVDTNKYLLPPCVAMSRLLYMSETLTGSRVPVSACVLWPFSPKNQGDGYPIAAWAHGTSGNTPDCAPSNHKAVWQHFLGPYQLVTQGYVVVATDYAGLGVHKTQSGEPIIHQYLACPSHANDIIYAVQAAQEAFAELSKHFVVVGHSQGGGAAWATAQRQVNQPISGYLGAVAISPVTTILDQPEPLLSVIGTAMCPGIATTFPDFKLADVLTPEGQQRLAMMDQAKAGLSSGMGLLLGANLMNEHWKENPYVQRYYSMISNGGKEIRGPLLVVHGGTDDKLNAAITTAAVNKTAEIFPGSQLEYYFLPNVSHVPALQATQRIWMEWIASRFAGCEVKPECRSVTLTPARPIESYQAEQNWYVEPATQFFHAP